MKRMLGRTSENEEKGTKK